MKIYVRLVALLLVSALMSPVLAGPPGPPRTTPKPGPAPAPAPGPVLVVPGSTTENAGTESEANESNPQRERAVKALMAVAVGAHKPDEETVKGFVDAMARVSDDNRVSPREMKTLETHLRRVLRSANVSSKMIDELETSMEAAAKDAGLSDEHISMLVSRASAVAKSLQAKQRAVR